MLGGFPLKVEVESVHWEDNGYSFLTTEPAPPPPHPAPDERGRCLQQQQASRLISPLTQDWLSSNYEVSEGSSVPRNVLYEHYLDFCVRNSVQPVNAASFGKIIRQHFPNLKTRRLGSRGQSKYHYYGLAIKASSQYHMNDYTAAPQQTSLSPVKPVPADVLASLLPDLPTVETLNPPTEASALHVRYYLDRYRTYSHSVLEVIVKATFSEVEPLLLKFWGSFSDEVLGSLNLFADLIAYCDLLLFKTIISLLLPTPLHPIPSSLTQTIRSFCKQYGGWSRMAVAGLPEHVVGAVVQASDIFVSMMRRQTTLTHIAQATRTVLSSASAVSQMIHDWCHLDIDSMTHQALFLFTGAADGDISSNVLKTIQSEFSELLGEQASVEEYSEWIRELVEKFVVKRSNPDNFKRHAQNFVTQWSYFISRIVRDLTLRSAPSFGSFHLLHMLFSDYVLHLIEEHQQTQKQANLWRGIAVQGASQPASQEKQQLPRTDNHVTQHAAQHVAQHTPQHATQHATQHVQPVEQMADAPAYEQEISVTDDIVEVTRSSDIVMSVAPSEDHVSDHVTSRDQVTSRDHPITMMDHDQRETDHIDIEGNMSAMLTTNTPLFSPGNTLSPAPSRPTILSPNLVLSPGSNNLNNLLNNSANSNNLNNLLNNSANSNNLNNLLNNSANSNNLNNLLNNSAGSNILSSSAGVNSFGNLPTLNGLPNLFTAEDLLDGDALSENLMEEILKCVSNSNCS